MFIIVGIKEKLADNKSVLIKATSIGLLPHALLKCIDLFYNVHNISVHYLVLPNDKVQPCSKEFDIMDGLSLKLISDSEVQEEYDYIFIDAPVEDININAELLNKVQLSQNLISISVDKVNTEVGRMAIRQGLIEGSSTRERRHPDITLSVEFNNLIHFKEYCKKLEGRVRTDRNLLLNTNLMKPTKDSIESFNEQLKEIWTPMYRVYPNHANGYYVDCSMQYILNRVYDKCHTEYYEDGAAFRIGLPTLELYNFEAAVLGNMIHCFINECNEMKVSLEKIE